MVLPKDLARLAKRALIHRTSVSSLRSISTSGHNRQQRSDESYLSGTSNAYIDDMYEQWMRDPSSIHPSWDAFFSEKEYVRPPNIGSMKPNEIPLAQFLPSVVGDLTTAGAAAPGAAQASDIVKNHMAVMATIRMFQVGGHLVANLDPLRLDFDLRNPNNRIPHAEILDFNMDEVYRLPETTNIGGGEKALPLKEIVKRLQEVYCGSIGLEYMYLSDYDETRWLRNKIETPGAFQMSTEDRIRLLHRLAKSAGFESFLAKKFPSEKRFGLEGTDVIIPAMRETIDQSSEYGVKSFVIGMPHRGRLNVLANVCGRELSDILTQFQGLEGADEGSGDVKYHLGSCIPSLNERTNKDIVISVVANPSHLEAVDPVVQGKTRAEQVYRGDREGKEVMSILIHGDAAFCGQGVVYETLQLSHLPAYTTHGTIHIVANNQIGFTTDPRSSRSSPYCTDIARVVGSPIFHVNADDPEAVIRVCNIAAEYRATFHKDIIIDLVGYRRYGHNEIDEPMFTQPMMYSTIAKMPTVMDKYAEKLINDGVVTKEEVEKIKNEYDQICENAYEKAQKVEDILWRGWLDSPWGDFFLEKDPLKVDSTGVEEEILTHIGNKFSAEPDDFHLHKGIKRILKSRREMVESRTIDWALGEAMAFGSLLKQGIHIRLSGQDVERGTFSHRHHILHDQKVDKKILSIINELWPAKEQAHYTVCNSSLSEYAILGFELGYSQCNPNSLIVWEAQFGDFANTAQCIIDQFIASGQAKWVRQSGLVMLLPHGMEGMGPEHSSARLERFLQLTADDPDHYPEKDENFVNQQLLDCNMIVANCTTPANLFHILRRQIALPFRKPLIIMTPKSLLRHPECRSSFDDMLPGTETQRLIPDTGPASQNPEAVKKIIFCSGKVYYDLTAARKEAGLESQIAIARIEQISPFPFDLVEAECAKYKNAGYTWVQEEHKNQGAWSYIQPRFQTAIGGYDNIVKYVGRQVAPSPATGGKAQYKKEFNNMISDAMNLD